MSSPSPLQRGVYYHLFNRGNNGANLFRNDDDYRRFLKAYTQHIEPMADTFVYCLMPNHFHLLVHIRDGGVTKSASQSFSNLFNAYTKYVHAKYKQTGSLFEHPFHRIPVMNDAYFMRLITYIHGNPQKHGFVTDFRDWKYSSYHTHLSNQPSRIKRDEVLSRFDGVTGFVQAHEQVLRDDILTRLLSEDFD